MGLANSACPRRQNFPEEQVSGVAKDVSAQDTCSQAKTFSTAGCADSTGEIEEVQRTIEDVAVNDAENEAPKDKNATSLTDKHPRHFTARDAHGGSHRARQWWGTAGYTAGTGSPIEVVRLAQKQWSEERPEQLLKWSFPTKLRDCLKISFRAAEKTASMVSQDFRQAFNELVSGYPPTVVRTVCHLYLNYLCPHHKRIQAHGRHLVMLKVYEGKRESHCWMIPLKEVIELHKISAEAMSGGISLNDVQLVQTYLVEDTFALHIETFERDPKRERNLYGTCSWVGGMVLHRITDDFDSPRKNKTQEFAMMPDEEMAELTERRGKTRERRARKKAEVKSKKDEEAAQLAEQARLAKEIEQAEAAAKRKEALLRPHESLSRLLKGDELDEMDDSDDGEDGLTEAELAAFAAAPRRTGKEGLLKPHPSLSKMLIDGARTRG